jgi:hypothetical protein
MEWPHRPVTSFGVQRSNTSRRVRGGRKSRNSTAFAEIPSEVGKSCSGTFPRSGFFHRLLHPQKTVPYLVALEIQLCSALNERFGWNWLDGDCLFEEPVDEFGSAARFAPVEPKREFIQPCVQMLQARFVLAGSEQPALEQSYRQMNPRYHFRNSLAVFL